MKIDIQQQYKYFWVRWFSTSWIGGLRDGLLYVVRVVIVGVVGYVEWWGQVFWLNDCCIGCGVCVLCQLVAHIGVVCMLFVQCKVLYNTHTTTNKINSTYLPPPTYPTTPTITNSYHIQHTVTQSTNPTSTKPPYPKILILLLYKYTILKITRQLSLLKAALGIFCLLMATLALLIIHEQPSRI